MNPSLTIYHPNPYCTGSALRLSLLPPTDGREGFFVVTLMKQNQGMVFPHYDTERAATVEITAIDAAKVLAVLDGKKDTNGGLFSNGGGYSSDFDVSRRHKRDRDKYHIVISRRDRMNGEVEEFQFTLKDIEAIAIREIVRSSMGVVAFGK